MTHALFPSLACKCLPFLCARRSPSCRTRACAGHLAGKWQARIKVRGRLIYLGYHDTPLQAAAAYDLAAYKTYGRGAVTNLELDSYGDGLLAALDAEPMDSLVARLRRSEERLRTRAVSTSSFRGISIGREGWKAQIKVNGRLLHLGHYKTQQHAAAAYEQAARSLHGAAPAVHGYVSSLATAASWEEQAQTASAAAVAHAALGGSLWDGLPAGSGDDVQDAETPTGSDLGAALSISRGGSAPAPSMTDSDYAAAVSGGASGGAGDSSSSFGGLVANTARGGAAGAPERCDQSEGPDAEMEPPSPPAYIGEKGCSIGRVVSSNGTQRIYQPVASKAVAGEPMGNLLLLLLNAAGDGGPSKAAHAA